MNTIIDVLSNPPEGLEKLLEYVRDSEFSMEDERGLAQFILDFKDNEGEYPSRAYASTQIGLVVERMEPLSLADIKHRFSEKFRERRRMHSSALLQEASRAVIEGQDPASLLEEVNRVFSSSVSGGIFQETEDVSIMSLVESRKGKSGVTFGMDEIDSTIIDLESGTMAVIAAFVGNGKTSSALSIANHMAISGYSSAYLTLESPPPILRTQLLSAFSFTPSWEGEPIPFIKILKRQLTPEEESLIPDIEASMTEQKGKVKIFSPSSIRGDLITSLPEVMEYFASLGMNSFFIDHAQLFKYYGKARGDVAAVDSTVKRCTDKAVELDERGYNFRTIFLSQINREGYKKALRRGGQYDLSALAEYSELERSASYILTMFLTDELKSLNEIKISLLKSRMGATIEEPISVFFDPSYSTVGGESAVQSFDADEGSVAELLGDSFDFTF